MDNLADGESRCRNPKLMSIMGATPLEHAEGAVAESQGSGIPAMIREMESRSLGRPKFIVKADSFTVLLSRHGAELAENRTWIQSHVGTELTDREETLLMFMREHGCVCDVQKIREALERRLGCIYFFRYRRLRLVDEPITSMSPLSAIFGRW